MQSKPPQLSPSKPLKVLHILADVLPGGMETLLVNLLREQARGRLCESSVAVIQMADDDDSLRSSIEEVARFHDLDCKSFFSRQFISKWKKLLKEENPDVVHCWSYDSGVVAGAIARYVFNIKVVWAIHSLDLPCRGDYSALRFGILKTVVGVASRVVPHQIISCSDEATNSHVEFGYPLDRCRAIDNGIDTYRYRINPIIRETQRRALNLETTDRLIGYIGRNHPVKRLEDFFAAASILMQSHKNIYFMALGFSADDLYPAAKEAYKKLPDPSRMHLLGRCPDPENYIPAADVTVLTSESEALPMVLMESLACGVPCVATKVGAASRIIGKHGRCVSAKDPQRMAEALIDVLGNDLPDLCPEAARAHCVRNFSIVAAEKSYTDSYLALANRQTPKSKIVNAPTVLHLVNDVGYGGAQVLLKRLSIGLKAKGFEQEVISVLPLNKIGQLAPEFEKAGIKVTSLEIDGITSGFRGLFKFAAMLREQKPSLVQTWMFHSALIGELASLISLRKVKTLWSIHHTQLGKESSKLTTRIIHKLLALISNFLPEKIIYCSKAGLDLHHDCGFDSRRSELIFNGTDTEVYQPNSLKKETLRGELNIPLEAPLIGMAGRYHPQKDFANLLQAFALVQKVIPNAHLLACGPGVSSETVPLRELADACPCPDQVHLIGPRRDMANIYPALTLCALSSCEGEAFPLVLGEAMSCEVPCVATDVGDSALIIGDTSRIVQPRDPQALAAVMISLLKLSPQALAELGEKARRRVQERFALDTYIDAHASLYGSMLDQSPLVKQVTLEPKCIQKNRRKILKPEAPAA